MSRNPDPDRHRPLSQRGFTLIEVMVGASLLALILPMILGAVSAGMAQSRHGYTRGQAAAWLEAEFDFLRAQGYAGLSDDVAVGTRTVTQTSGYTTHGELTEPRLPPHFDHAAITVSNVGGLSLRKLTVVLYETPTSAPYVAISTYVANVTFMQAP